MCHVPVSLILIQLIVSGIQTQWGSMKMQPQQQHKLITDLSLIVLLVNYKLH